MRLSALLFALLVFCGGPAWPQTASTQSTSTVVAAWSFPNGTPVPDSSVAVPMDKRRAYEAVETYVWNALPPDVRVRVSRLELFTSSGTAADASDGTAEENEDGTTWTLSLDGGEGESAVMGGARADEQVFDEVIAHEVGHILSLNEGQRTDAPVADAYSDDEGSFTKAAYLRMFWKAFWEGRYPDRDGGQAEQASARNSEHPDAFVTEYAATDPSEDFAESFAWFVLEQLPASKAETTRKLRFFYSYPELVRDRTFMRKALASVH